MMKNNVQNGIPYYIELFGNEDYRELLQSNETSKLLGTISEQKAGYRYASDKWSIKQIVGHITDHERVMVYRMLRFTRKDTTQLPGYDQNLFVANSRFDELTLQQLVADFQNVRNATISFVSGLSEAQLNLRGLVWNFELKVEDFLVATIGHEIHHRNIIKERYL